MTVYRRQGKRPDYPEAATEVEVDTWPLSLLAAAYAVFLIFLTAGEYMASVR